MELSHLIQPAGPPAKLDLRPFTWISPASLPHCPMRVFCTSLTACASSSSRACCSATSAAGPAPLGFAPGACREHHKQGWCRGPGCAALHVDTMYLVKSEAAGTPRQGCTAWGPVHGVPACGGVVCQGGMLVCEVEGEALNCSSGVAWAGLLVTLPQPLKRAE